MATGSVIEKVADVHARAENSNDTLRVSGDRSLKEEGLLEER